MRRRMRRRTPARFALLLLPLLLLLLGSDADDPDGAGPAPLLDPARFGIVDLSHAYGEDTLYWPTSPSRFELETLAEGRTEGGWFYAANRLRTPEHGGTHLDAPHHFHETGQDAAGVPLERLIGPAFVIDVTQEASADRDYRLTPARVAAFEEAHGRIPEGAIVLLHTGWSSRWPDALRYLGDDAPGDASSLHFPAFGEAATRLLVEERGIAALGLDTASLDHGPSTDFPVHRITAAADVPGLENLTGLEALPATGAWIFALPMKITGGSGAPVRVAALVPR